MIVTDLSNSFNPVPKIKTEKKKEVIKIKGKKHKQTKEKEIPKKVKEAVWKRDKYKCIFCHKQVPVECACCHFIPRSSGGLGIPENIFTACEDCHREQDNGKNTKVYDKKAERHLKRIYGVNWDKSKLVYKKYNKG
ncbi:MAG: HNH endonuclease [Clostridia bacterium]